MEELTASSPSSRCGNWNSDGLREFSGPRPMNSSNRMSLTKRSSFQSTPNPVCSLLRALQGPPQIRAQMERRKGNPKHCVAQTLKVGNLAADTGCGVLTGWRGEWMKPTRACCPGSKRVLRERDGRNMGRAATWREQSGRSTSWMQEVDHGLMASKLT